jgi:hypothetical protein
LSNWPVNGDELSVEVSSRGRCEMWNPSRSSLHSIQPLSGHYLHRVAGFASLRERVFRNRERILTILCECQPQSAMFIKLANQTRAYRVIQPS